MSHRQGHQHDLAAAAHQIHSMAGISSEQRDKHAEDLHENNEDDQQVPA